MPTATMSVSGSIGGISFQGTAQRTGDGQLSVETTVNAAQAGTLSTRTSNTDGTLTLGANHGVVNTNVLDIFWTDANGLPQVAYGATAANVSGNAVPFTGAAGTSLPDANTAITAGVVREADRDFDGDNLAMLMISSNRKGHIRFADAGGATLLSQKLVAGEPWAWVSNQGIANPLTGNAVASVHLANGDSTANATMKVAGLDNVVT